MAGILLHVTSMLLLSAVNAVGTTPWCPKFCECNNSFNTVDCSNIALHNIPEAHSRTTHFYLDHNQIDSIDPDIFNSTPKVAVLNLENNVLLGVDANVLCTMRSLQEVNFSHNNLKVFSITVEDSTGCQLLQLKVLDLSSNELHHIPRNVSHLAPNLEIFNLSVNRITSPYMEWGFSTMAALTNLDLHSNPLHGIQNDDLLSLHTTSLQVLGMSDCRLMAIEDRAFAGLINLTSLDLSRNLLSLKTVETVLHEIGKYNELAYLDLSEMQLSNLTLPMLGTFLQLVHLDVTNSLVENIDAELFKVLSQLETLHLDENRLTKLEGLSHLTKLRRLYVRNNRLQEINVTGLQNLEQVDISGNDLTSIPHGWLDDIHTIKLFNISNNHITNMSADAFSTVTLHSLDMSHNQMTALHSLGSLKVNKLDLSHNHLNYIAVQALTSLANHCCELDFSHNNLFTFPNHTYHSFTSLQQLNLAHNKLGSAFSSGELLTFLQSLHYLQILDISHNNISRLSPKQFQYLHHLTLLYLSDNRIQDLAQLSLGDMKSLAKLVVANNELRQVQTRVLSSLAFLAVVDMSDNPYHCDCSLLPFLHWLNTTMVKVQYIDSPSLYTCRSPASLAGSHILTYSPRQQQCVVEATTERTTTHRRHLTFNRDLAIVVIPLTCLLVAVIFVVLVLCYGKVCHRIKSLHYRWQIRYREVSGVEIAADQKT